MRGVRTSAACGLALLVFAAAASDVSDARPAPAAAGSCERRVVTDAYGASVRQAALAKTDVWGSRLVDAGGGPTLAGAQRLLAPLTQGVEWQGKTLTKTGSYYLPLSFPFSSYGSTVYALHVADGSQIVTRRIDGPSLSVYVGSGHELYGSCPGRLDPARLADGSLPILDTAYRDEAGVRYEQESFVGRIYGKYGAPSIISFVKLDVDATDATGDATIRLVASQRLAHSAPDRLSLKGKTRLIVSGDAQFVDGVARWAVPAGTTETIYAEWLNAPSQAQYVHADAATYDQARATVASFWQSKLAQGASFEVPEPAVQNAENAILEQLIAYGWRYSVGNPYEELSYGESLDAAGVAAEYGLNQVARSIIELSLKRMRIRPLRFTAFRGAHILATAALYFRLTHDRDFLRKQTPALASLVTRIAARQRRSGPARGRLLPEPLSTDLENQDVDSVSGQIEAVQGLRAIGRVWRIAGYSADASRASKLAASLDAALRPAVRRASKKLPDGSLFVPDQLGGQKPFKRVSATRDGSYWNLIMPYAFSSGWFAAGSAQARGVLRYLDMHGARLLGMPRTYAHTVYGDDSGVGVNPVYELGVSRFLADQDQPDQLVLSLYGMLAAGMSDTFVSGEAVSLVPLRGAYDRTMFMPPNTGANASFLGTLREQLVHERRNAFGAPAGLDLAFSTPRAWLADGGQIAVHDAPTSFGKVSYTLARLGSEIDGTLTLPPGAAARVRLRLPAGEHVAAVRLDGARVPVAADGTVVVGKRRGEITLVATVE